MARTATVVGTATAKRNTVNRRQANKNAEVYTQATNTAAAQQASPPQEQYHPPEPANYPEGDIITKLEPLCALKTQGLLTNEEFAVAKQKLMAG
jgi:hypothetical protein